MWKYKKESKALNLLIIFLIAILSGIVGSLIIQVYVPDYSDVSYLIFGQERPKEIVIDQDEQIAKIIDSNRNGVASIYKKIPKAEDYLNQIYSQNNYLGSAIILTSDGWLLTNKSVIKGYAKEGMVASYNQDLYDIEKIIQDNETNAIFIKLKTERNLQNIKVAEFTDNEIINGSQVIVLNQDNNYITNVEDSNFLNAQILSTDFYSDLIKLKDALPSYYLGSPVMTLDGKIIGMVDTRENNTRYAIKAKYFKDKYKDAIKNQELSANKWGINYIDLSKTTGIEIIYNNEKLKKGALIYSLESNGMFYGSKLQKGDVIIKVEDDEVKLGRNLKDILDEYLGIESIKIEYVRDGESREINLNI